MPLSPGARLGAYEIIAALGAGGMGEVYKARDTRLDRTVAIKVMTGAMSADSEARARFEQEARAIAALNHPHICTIHDVGHDEVDYLVMEHLEGQTLADRLKGGPLKIEDALAIAIQIADALSAAHRVGIAHRDLKPGNVMLLRGAQGSTTAKLLDFGLAAEIPSNTAGSAALHASLLATTPPSMLVTRPPSATTPTSFSGTVQYMAPEQMDGKPADHRADIFAFGCVLYEMLSGRKAFEGGTAVTVIAAVMSSEPKPIAALQSAPPVLDHLLRRCLEKDPEQRWQSMGDVSGELRWIAGQPLTVAVAAPERKRPSVWQRTAAITASVVVLFGILPLAMLAALQWLSPPEAATQQQPVLRFEVPTAPTDDSSVALSPDGSQIAFVANQNRRPMLWVRRLDTVESKVLPGTEGANYAFWSPDGRTIAFFADNKLKRIEVAGGTPLVLTDAPTARGGAWGPDGVILFAPGVNASITRISTSGGQATKVTTLNTGSGPSHRWPQFLPDRKRFLFHSSLGTAETNGVYIGSLDGTAPVRILPNELAGSFVPPDTFLTVRQGALVAYTFNKGLTAIEGEPVVVAQGLGSDGVGVASFSTSDNGVLAYRAGGKQRRQLVWTDRQGRALASIGEPGTEDIGSPELSPDERTVAVFEHPTGDNDIWVIDLARGLPRRITNGPPADAHPIWDPDGRHVVFSGQRLKGAGAARQSVDGVGDAGPLFPTPIQGLPLSWSRDRRFVLLRRSGAEDSPDLVAVSIDGQQTVPITQSPFDETEGQFSPDGKWVAFVSNETGRPEIFVQSFPERGGRTQVSTAGGTQVRWAADSKEIFYISPDGKMTAVSMAVGGGGSPELKPPVALFETHLATGANVIGNKPQYAVSRDGRFLLNTTLESASAPIIVTMNWMRALAR